MFRQRLFTSLLALAALAVLLAACSSEEMAGVHSDIVPQVTTGTPDGDLHPHVGLMVANDAAGNPLWRCSGTLIDANVFLTAGHCTEAPAASATIWFAEDMRDNDDYNYPFGPADASGTTLTHPQYNPNAFFLYDLGVVILDSPVEMDTYGTLPELDQLDELKPNRRTVFTAVGYGVQRVHPNQFADAGRDRQYAQPHLVQINTPGFTGDFSLLLSNNHRTGGTCFGDSGGPNFLGDENSTLIAGVTSFGLNGQCAGTGGVYRIDRADDLDWLNEILGTYGSEAP